MIVKTKFGYQVLNEQKQLITDKNIPLQKAKEIEKGLELYKEIRRQLKVPILKPNNNQ